MAPDTKKDEIGK